MRLVAVVFASLCASAAFAYEEDVHFTLTYALCRVAGMTAESSLTVASADQGMDDNDTTKAEHELALKSDGFEAFKRKTWHALDDSREKVLKQREVLRKRAVDAKSLVLFGQYMHFFQDSFSHREVKGENWQPFGWRIGHGLKGHQPDRVAADVSLAKEMAKAVAEQAAAFLTETGGKAASIDSKAIDAMVDALAKCYGKDMLGYWNHARMENVPNALETALKKFADKAPTGDDWAIPKLERILGLKFDKEGNPVGPVKPTG